MAIQFEKLSEKQLKVFSWWAKSNTTQQGIICDGAVRSGKTVCMCLSFVLWAFSQFESKNFALCGKTLHSLQRNVVKDLIENLTVLGFEVHEKKAENYLSISFNEIVNRFYLFSGNNEGSAQKIQGITLAGVLFDEVALMPQSFVNQAIARCSQEKSTFWFNCNPEHPYHWFYLEWILKAKEKKLVYLHFTMADNPALSPSVKKRYQGLYTGPFYERFVLGKWSATFGAVYTLFDEKVHCYDYHLQDVESYYISCDYGIQNPFSIGLFAIKNNCFYRVKEWYYDGRKTGVSYTDEEYYKQLKDFAGKLKIKAVIVDPSASSFISLIRSKGEFQVLPAKNNVLQGIQKVNQLLKEKRLFIHKGCKNCLREFHLYQWDNHKQKENPKKENDHCMDELRYFVASIASEEQQKKEDFFVLSTLR